MRRLALLLLLICILPLEAQEYSSASKKAIKFYKEAETHFTYKRDKEAEEQLKKALETDDRFIEAWFMLAQIYFDKNNVPQAIAYYNTGIEIDPDRNRNGYLRLAELEFSIGWYSESKVHLDSWNAYAITDEKLVIKANQLAMNLDFALYSIEHPVEFKPESLGEAVNTSRNEYWPSLSVDEKSLFFTVLLPQNEDWPKTNLKFQEDFYYCTSVGGTWVNRTPLGPPVNTNANEGAQSITADGRFIFFTACNRSDGISRLCDVYYAYIQDDGSWSKPINLGRTINTGASEKHPSISPDGRTLYFSSNRGGGNGNYDIWMSEFKNGSWSSPVNLGDSINTPGIEQSPFIHPDQQSLYFSSTGWPGMGQADIYLSRKKEDGSWSTPENLGYPINTFNDDIGLIVNAKGTKAFYSSTRREGTDTDIFTFDMPPEVRPAPVSYVSGRVYSSRTYKGISAVMQLFDLSTGSLVIESQSNNGEGDYLIALPSGNEYAFNVMHPGFLFYSDHFFIDKNYSSLDPLKLDIALDPIQSGEKMVLKNIFYDTEAYSLKRESKVELEKVIDFLQMNPSVRIEISGHTDNTGSADYNLELSRKRAESVVNYLIKNGVRSERLVSKGYGDTMPFADNVKDEGRARNRRTELKVL
ncbi:OmpA family protein [Bacteroidota bacterium]